MTNQRNTILDPAEIICVVLNNETILIGELIDGALDELTISIKECGAVVPASPDDEPLPEGEHAGEYFEPDRFFIRDFLGELVDETRSFTIRTDSIMMVFYPPDVAIDAYWDWIESVVPDETELVVECEDEDSEQQKGDKDDNEDNVIKFNPSDDL